MSISLHSCWYQSYPFKSFGDTQMDCQLKCRPAFSISTRNIPGSYSPIRQEMGLSIAPDPFTSACTFRKHLWTNEAYNDRTCPVILRSGYQRFCIVRLHSDRVHVGSSCGISILVELRLNFPRRTKIHLGEKPLIENIRRLIQSFLLQEYLR